MGIADYLEIAKGFIRAFGYWQQIAILLCGITSGYLLRIITLKLRILRLSKKGGGGNIVVFERQTCNKKKKDISTHYFKCIKNAQYSTEDWQGTKDMGKGIKLIK